MKRHRGLFLALLGAFLLVGFLRLFMVSLLVIPQEGERPVFYAGDRVLVNKLSYGVRIPFIHWFGYHRLGKGTVDIGHWVAFNNPIASPKVQIDRKEVFVGRCIALPGDTLWINAQGRVNGYRKRSQGYIWPIVVPRKGQTIQFTPWTLNFYSEAIGNHEAARCGVIDNALYIHGKVATSFRFKHDYYWMASADSVHLNDSRVFGFVPQSHLIGRLVGIVYSVDSNKPWYKKIRLNRCFKGINE